VKSLAEEFALLSSHVGYMDKWLKEQDRLRSFGKDLETENLLDEIIPEAIQLRKALYRLLEGSRMAEIKSGPLRAREEHMGRIFIRMLRIGSIYSFFDSVKDQYPPVFRGRAARKDSKTERFEPEYDPEKFG
jgi:hypothetical protein